MIQFRTWMMQFGTDAIQSKKWCDYGLNHTAESQSDCTDRQWFKSGCNKLQRCKGKKTVQIFLSRRVEPWMSQRNDRLRIF